MHKSFPTLLLSRSVDDHPNCHIIIAERGEGVAFFAKTHNLRGVGLLFLYYDVFYVDGTKIFFWGIGVLAKKT